MKKIKYPCPCCDNYTLARRPPGTFDLCSVCFWEDDNVQFLNPDYEGGANDICLNKARENYKKMGVISKSFLDRIKT